MMPGAPPAPQSAPPLDALAALRDIHLPDPVSAWPPAPGWWLLAAVAVAACVALLLWWRARQRSARVAALAELDRLARTWREQQDVAALALGLSSLLRRVALARFPREEVAALHGAERLAFLERAAQSGFPREVGEALESSLYRRPVDAGGARDDAEVARWLGAVRRWIGAAT
jgi:hypothetical protein